MSGLGGLPTRVGSEVESHPVEKDRVVRQARSEPRCRACCHRQLESCRGWSQRQTRYTAPQASRCGVEELQHVGGVRLRTRQARDASA